MDFRTLRSESRWRFRGKDYSRPFSQTQLYTTYDSEVTHTGSGAGVQERASNLYADGVAETVVRVDGTSIVNIDTFALTNTIVVTDHVSTELRSPVRQGDQYTVFERYGFDLGVDLDADGRNELADTAVYRRVVGMETLPAQPFAFGDTIRVDTFSVARIRPTTGAAPTVATVVESIWYAKGAGVVRRTFSVPGSSRALEFAEELVGWDGLTEGIGYTAPTEMRLAGGVTGLGEAIVQLVAATTFESHALTISKRSPTSNLLGMRVSKIDLRGRLLESFDYPDAQISVGSPLAFIRNRDRAYIVGPGTQANRMVLMRLSANGENVDGPTGGIELPVGPPSLTDLRYVSDTAPAVTAVADELWTIWQRSYRTTPTGNDFAAELVARPFDSSGNALAAETVLFSGGVSQISQPRMGRHASGAMLTFSVLDGNSRYVSRFALLTRAGNGPIVANSSTLTGQIVGEGVMPISLSGGEGLLWQGRQDDGSSNLGALTLHGVSILPSGAAGRAGSGPNWDSEDLPGSVFDTSAKLWSSPGVDRTFLVAIRNESFWPEDINPQAFYSLGHFKPGNGPWALTGQQQTMVRVPYEGRTGLADVLVFPDRLLLLSSPLSADPITTTTVWLRGFN